MADGRGKNPNSLKNLNPVKPGESRNPKGNPSIHKIPSINRLLAEVLEEKNKDGISAAKAILMGLRAKAIQGDVKAAEMLFDRAYGKPKQRIDLAAATVIVDFRDAE